MKGLIYGLLLVLSSILAHAEDRPLPMPPSHPFPLGECPECERESIQYQAAFGRLQPPASEFGPSAPDSMRANEKESEVADFLGLSKLAAKNILNLALTIVTDENDIWLLKSTLGALEDAQIRMESWREDTGLRCDLDENGFVQFDYPREIFVCNRFINFFPDLNNKTVAMAQLLIHEATHLAEIDDGTRIKGTPEGCRATYVETLVTQLTSRNHRPVYRTYDMDRCEKEGQD
jgi:hypothetical protein